MTTISTKTIPTNFNKKKVTCKKENFYILLTFLLIPISLLIIAGIYCYLIKHQLKQEHLLAYYDTSNKLKEIDINNMIRKWVINKRNRYKKNHTYYFFDDMINIKNLDPNKINIDG